MSYSLLFCPFGQQKKDTTFAVSFGVILLSCVPDIDVVGAVSGGFVPHPHIGNIRVVCISIQSAADVPLQAGAARPGPDGVVPAVYRAALQPQTQALGATLRIADSVADVEGGFLYDRLWRGFCRGRSRLDRCGCWGWRLRGRSGCRYWRCYWRWGGSCLYGDFQVGVRLGGRRLGSGSCCRCF